MPSGPTRIRHAVPLAFHALLGATKRPERQDHDQDRDTVARVGGIGPGGQRAGEINRQDAPVVALNRGKFGERCGCWRVDWLVWH